MAADVTRHTRHGASGEQRVSVIVVNYNAGDLLAACAASVLPHVHEIVVVDNGSRDHSLALLEQLPDEHARLKVIRTGRNLGFAAACNIGMAATDGDCLLFLNPDCRLEADAISAMLAALDSNDNCGMVGALLLNDDGSEQRGCRRNLPTLHSAFLRLFGLGALTRRWPRHFPPVDLVGQPLPTTPQEVEAISGACMLVRRDAASQVGGWDEGYFLHCEDLDWCMRFRQHGWQVLFAPQARGTHLQGSCSRATPLFVEWHKHLGMLRYFRKFSQGWRATLLATPVTAGVALHFMVLLARHGGRRVTAMMSSGRAC